MGSWGVEILANDCALDLMPTIVAQGNVRASVKRLLDAYDFDEQMLGVGLVDAALNGYSKEIMGYAHEYISWIEGLKDVSLYDYRELALIVLREVRVNEAKYWVPEALPKRRALLGKLEKRLVNAKPSKAVKAALAPDRIRMKIGRGLYAITAKDEVLYNGESWMLVSQVNQVNSQTVHPKMSKVLCEKLVKCGALKPVLFRKTVSTCKQDTVAQFYKFDMYELSEFLRTKKA